MAYSTISNSEIAVGAPLTNALLIKIRDNPEAIALGLSGATRIATNALGTGVVTSTKVGANAINATHLAANSVGASEIGTGVVGASELGASSVGTSELAAGAVHQVDLDTTLNQGNTTNNVPTLVNIGGGTYAFYPQIRASAAVGNGVAVASIAYLEDPNSVGTSGSVTTSFTTWITLASASGQTTYAQSRQIDSSPPYDLGDGPTHGFVYAEIEKGSGVIKSTTSSVSAPWHYSGPTDIRGKKKKDGKSYQLIRDVTKTEEPYAERGELFKFRAEMKAFRPSTTEERLRKMNYIRELSAAKMVEVEVTQDIKNADMGLIPKTIYSPEDSIIVLLDPMSEILAELMPMRETGEIEISDLLYDGVLKVGNDPLPRHGPPGVDIMPIKWCNNG